MSPLVSIITPCHNAARWLESSLRSSLDQTWPNLEVILVDDGSTDDSVQIARGLESSGRLTIVTQPKSGQCAACNHGLRVARGDYVKFFDADDLLSPRAVEIQVSHLRERPDCLGYAEWARFTDRPEDARFEPRVEWQDGAPVDWLVRSWSGGAGMMQCGQFLIPRPLLASAGGWNEELGLINDLEFFTRLIVASRGVVFTPGARLYYRSGIPGSLSGSRSAAAWRSAWRSAMLAADHLLGAEDSARTRRAAATTLASVLYAMYPNCPDLCRSLEARVAGLGGTDLRPSGGRAFRLASRIIGWKPARWVQVANGKYPRPLAR